MVGTGDLDHALGEVNARDTSAPVMELLGQIPRATACVEYREPLDVTCQCPEHRVGIQDAVGISLIPNLSPPVVCHAVPEVAGFVIRVGAHSTVSCRGAWWLHTVAILGHDVRCSRLYEHTPYHGSRP